MWDLLELVLSGFAEIAAALWERFAACFLLSCAAAGLILCFVSPRTLAVVIAIAVVVLGTVFGIAWERQC